MKSIKISTVFGEEMGCPATSSPHSELSVKPLYEEALDKTSNPACRTRRSVCISAAALLVLAAVATVVGLAVTLGLLLRTPVNRFCAASHNRTGFLCDDRVTCVPASRVCNGIRDCRNGEDEQEKLCGDLPRSLPGYLVFRCSNPAYWISADQRCDGMNDCGDCSDEMESLAGCPPCGSEWWSCTPVLYEYCTCIPKRLCRDSVQHCASWSDEYICTP